MIAARNAFLMSGAKLPYDAEVEYIESTGTQYIDTGIVPADTTGAHLCFAYSPYDEDSWCPLGARTGTNGRWWINKSNFTSGLTFGRGGWYASQKAQPANTILDCSLNYLNARTFAYANFSYSQAITSTISALSHSVFLFAANLYGTASLFPPGSCKIYECQLSVGAEIVRDFTPVRVGSGSSAVGYLYDRANPTGGPLGNGLYGNAADGQGGVTGFAQFGADK